MRDKQKDCPFTALRRHTYTSARREADIARLIEALATAPVIIRYGEYPSLKPTEFIRLTRKNLPPGFSHELIGADIRIQRK